jgi:hypothetical protein
MFEVTIRTDNQAALEQLMEFLKGLDLKIIQPLKDSKRKKAGSIKIKVPIEGATPQTSEGMGQKTSNWGGMGTDFTDVKPGFGCLKGKIHLAPDWDEPLEDFKEYMY